MSKDRRAATKDIFLKVLRTSASLQLPEDSIHAAAVTIGNFDGCHRGHRELIGVTRKLAQTRGLASVVLTFDPNPKQFFQPQKPFGKLFKAEQKLRALQELGIDMVIVQSFDAAFSQLSPRAFYQQLLRDKVHAQAVIVGEDFCFGAQREGNLSTLKSLASEFGAEVLAIHQQDFEGQVVSSSGIRRLLMERNIKLANDLLGRPYLIEGEVLSGKKLGRSIGFPTANLEWGDQLLPGLGVYAGFAHLGEAAPILQLDTGVIPCILNIGLRPTVDQPSLVPKVEVHLLEGEYPTEGLYGQKIGVYLTNFIRAEKRFESIDALKQQISRDCDEARVQLMQARLRWLKALADR